MFHNEAKLESKIVHEILAHYAYILNFNDIKEEYMMFIHTNVKNILALKRYEATELDMTHWANLVRKTKFAAVILLSKLDISIQFALDEVIDSAAKVAFLFAEKEIDKQVEEARLRLQKDEPEESEESSEEDNTENLSKSEKEAQGRKLMEELIEMLKSKGKKVALTSIHLKGNFNKKQVDDIIKRLIECRDKLDEMNKDDSEEVCPGCGQVHDVEIPKAEEQKEEQKEEEEIKIE